MKRHTRSMSAQAAPVKKGTAPLCARHLHGPSGIRGLSPFSRPRAFTLVELLVVITIIGILAGLITAAAIRARITAKQTAISMELSQLEMALQSYKEKFGEYPPDFAGINSGVAADEADAQAAVMRHIRKAFPRCTTITNWTQFENFMSSNSIPVTPQSALVFWLGGLKDATTGKPIGFSANPANPFDATSTSRISPFYDFDQTRLNVPNGYLYWPKEADNHTVGSGAITYFRAENSSYAYPTSTTPKSVADAVSTVVIYPAQNTELTGQWVNPKSVQIFTSGLDKTYGALTVTPLQFPSGNGYGERTYDDITNFSGGTLEDAMP